MFTISVASGVSSRTRRENVPLLVVFHLMIHLQRGERVMEMKWFVDLFQGLEKNGDLERSP